MTIDFPCTHPDNWPCKDSRINPGSCGTQEVHDAAMGCIDGHYALNPQGNAGAGEVEMHDSELHKTGWTGNSEVVTLDDDDEDA
jgi:hypothetical protein